MQKAYQHNSVMDGISLTDRIMATSSVRNNSISKSTWVQSFRRFLPILAFDLVSVTLVLVTCYEFTRAKLISGLLGSEAFFMVNLDKVILYTLLVIMILSLFFYSGLYIHHVIQTRAKQFFYIVKSFFYADVFIIVISFFFLSSTLTATFREFIIWFTVSGILFTFTGRMIFRYLIRTNKSLSTLKPPRRLIIIGAGEAAKLYAARIINDRNVESIIFLDDDPEKHGTTVFGFPVEGRTADVSIRAASFKADEICVLINKISKERLLEIVQLAKKTSLPVKISSSHYNLMFTGIYDQKEESVESVPFISKDYQKLDLVYKRVLDFIGASIMTVLLLIPGLIIASVILLTSKGPALHTSFRVGKGGRLFKMYKFRSMEINNGVKHLMMATVRTKNGFHTGKVENDPRITSFR